MDFYAILGLERGASPRDIQRAYRRLARRFHPDINPGDETAEVRFRQIVEAFETLSDPDRRRHYDAQGAPERFTGVTTSFEFRGFDFSATGEIARGPTFGDLFADVFRRRIGGAARLERGSDLHTRITVSFADAMIGAEGAVTVTRLETCPACRGAGVIESPDAGCPQCGGSGSVRSVRGHMVFSKTCPGCAGTGRLRSRGCGACNGEGVTPRTETVAVRMPAGVTDGTRIRVPGKGHIGRRRGHAGDLYVTVQIEPHRLFRRDEDDLILTVPVAVHEAALGAKVEVPTLEGPARLRIPPGTQSGQRFRLRGRGAPSSRGEGQRGDLIAEVKLVLPRIIDERSKELLRELARLHTEDVRADLWREGNPAVD